MKSVFIIAIVAVAMIGVMVPSSFAETYIHDDPKFSINYPSEWIIDDSQNFEDFGISFFNKDDWTSMIQVFLYENKDFIAKNIEELKIEEENLCQNSSFEFDGLICYDFEIIDEMVSEDSDGHETFMIIYYHVNEYGDEDFAIPYPMISSAMSIVDGDNVWQIISITEMDEFEFYTEDLTNSIASFKILTDTNVLNNSESNLMIDDKINGESFTELPHLEKYLNFDNSGWVVSESESFVTNDYGNPVNNYMKVFEKDYVDSSVTFIITEFVSHNDALQRYDEEETKWINFGTPYEEFPLKDEGNCLAGEVLMFYTVGCIVDNLMISMIFDSNVSEQEILLFSEKLFNNLHHEKFKVIEEPVAALQESSEESGGCLIATATYGSEMAPQVQQLRELRDNQLLQTESGAAFMSTFNDIYYSFSPTIADYERENPYFKEAVKLAITPMISSLSLMENAESESEVLSIGISVIALNIGMYLGIPVIAIVGLRRII